MKIIQDYDKKPNKNQAQEEPVDIEATDLQGEESQISDEFAEEVLNILLETGFTEEESLEFIEYVVDGLDISSGQDLVNYLLWNNNLLSSKGDK
ncbi:MAG: hypothetical protein AAF621_04660 [Pseudomonadota bacterium]